MSTENCCEFDEEVLSRPIVTVPTPKPSETLVPIPPPPPTVGKPLTPEEEILQTVPDSQIKYAELAIVILEVLRERAVVEFPQSNRAAPSAKVLVFPRGTSFVKFFPYRADWKLWQTVAVPTITKFVDKRFLPDTFLIDKILLELEIRV